MSVFWLALGGCSLAVGLLALALRGNWWRLDDRMPGRDARRRSRATADRDGPGRHGVLLAFGLSQITIGVLFVALGIAHATR